MSFASLRRVLRAARKGLCATCSKTRYPQLEAAGSGHVGCLIYTIETIGTLIKDEHDVTAMHVAARKGQISVLIYIIENNVIDKREIPRAKNGATPAHDAAGTGNLDCLRYLINSTPAGPNDLDANSATPLHWAAQSGHLNVVEWLVKDAKSPIDVVTKNGVTPFHLSAVKNHLPVLKWLVSYAFRTHPRPMKLINAKDKNGSTPVYLGAHAGNIEVIKWLIEKGGGDPAITNREGLAPIHAAASNGHIECVKFLFQYGQGSAPGGLRTSDGACALHFAAAEGEVSIVQWLLTQEDCTGDERDYFQSTPLHDAAENGHLIILKTLCDHGCDPGLLDVDGNKAADLARKNSHNKCVAYLDSYMKRVLWSKMNGVKRDSHQGPNRPLSKTQKTAQSKVKNPSQQHSMDGKKSSGLENQWVTVRDLLEEDEIKQMDEADVLHSSADKKRRLFEEKLAQEQEEREMKKVGATAKKPAPLKQEKEFRTQLIGSKKHESEVLEVLKSFDSALQEGLENNQTHRKATNDGQMERKGSKWISGLLRKRDEPTTTNKDKVSKKPRRRGSDPSEWNIPSPPPIPKLKYLLSRQKKPQKQGSNTSTNLTTPKWGRDAYDDGMDSDESSIGGSRENIHQLKSAHTHQLMQQKNALKPAQTAKTGPSKQPQTRGMGPRKDTPRPASIQQAVPTGERLQPIPFNLEPSNDTAQHSAPIARLTNTRKHPSPVLRHSREPTPPGIKRQDHIVEEEAPDYEETNEVESSSEDEESTESESTDSESESEEDDDEDRPIMAQNVGIHGAKIAKQVMQRMKSQRYPSIFSKPIITLDTIVDVRFERPYQTNTVTEKADTLQRLHAQKKVWDAWKKDVELTKFARNEAYKMLQRRKKALIAEIFYAWVQAKNEAEVEKAERKQLAIKHHRLKTKKRLFRKWKELVNQEKLEKNPTKNIHNKHLHWLNIQLARLQKGKVNELVKPLEDGTLMISILANISGNKAPRHKTIVRHDLHKVDNWKVAHQFMKKIGVNTKDFEPADLANSNEAAIVNMLNNVVKWADSL